MTISPPSKVNTGLPLEPKVLASGIDSFNMALDIIWPDDIFFKILDMYKSEAQKFGSSYPFFISVPELDDRVLFNVLPNGTKGYNWIISGNEYSVRFLNSVVPNSRPNAMVEIRSETIWRRGIREATNLILTALEKHNAEIVAVKPSRIDLCMDLYIPSYEWDVDLFKNMVSRSRSVNHYFKNNQLTGVHIGKGKLSCRMYDKDLEIRTISKKLWMYEVWGLPEVPANKKVIRIEFQLLREAIKELGIETLYETLRVFDNIWGYCTQQWLKFESNPGKHHTQRKTLPWWETVQSSFQGVIESTPAIRAKAIRTDQKQLASQILGLTTSYAATKPTMGNDPFPTGFTKEDLVKIFQEVLDIANKTDRELGNTVNKKRVRYYHGKQKYLDANQKRLEKELPADELTFVVQQNLEWEAPDDAS